MSRHNICSNDPGYARMTHVKRNAETPCQSVVSLYVVRVPRISATSAELILGGGLYANMEEKVQCHTGAGSIFGFLNHVLEVGSWYVIYG